MSRIGRVQAHVIASLRSGWRLAVRELGEEKPHHSCLLYTTNLSTDPPYRRLRWQVVNRLIERGALVQTRRMYAEGGCEKYFSLTDEWKGAPTQ